MHAVQTSESYYPIDLTHGVMQMHTYYWLFGDENLYASSGCLLEIGENGI